MAPHELTFTSELPAPPAEVWRRITSLASISRELRPYLRMTAPPGVDDLASLDVVLGRPLFRSRLYLFGVVPIGASRLTLAALDDGVGFLEQSPMTGMRLWRHERTITPAGGGSVVTDRLTFEPAWGGAVVAWFVRRLFEHRHAVLRRG